MKWWPFKRDDSREAPLSPETRVVVSRSQALDSRVDALGVETRAVAREALYIRHTNHFGPALIAAFSTPRRAP